MKSLDIDLLHSSVTRAHSSSSSSSVTERDESPRRHSLTALPSLTRTQSNPFIKRQSLNSHLSSYTRPAPDPRITLLPAHLPSKFFFGLSFSRFFFSPSMLVKILQKRTNLLIPTVKMVFPLFPFLIFYYYFIWLPTGIKSGESGSLPCSGPSSSASSSASLNSPPGSPMHLQEDFVRSKEFQQVVQGKLVTLEELVHMRRVLTAASLDNLPLDSSIKDDVVNGKVSRKRLSLPSSCTIEWKAPANSILFSGTLKVCFVCRKTRFSVFGSWWHNCKLCRRTVCTKCCTKVSYFWQ